MKPINGGHELSRQSLQALHDAAAMTRQQASELGAAALDRLGPVLTQTVERVTPYADEAVIKAKAARAKAAGWAADRVEHLQPTLYSALDLVPPAIDRAHRSLEQDVIPGLVEALHDAAGDRLPALAEASGRVGKPRRVGRTILWIGLAAAAAGAVAMAIKTWLTDSNPPQWSTPEPREAYVYPDDMAGEASAEAKDYETDSYIGANPPDGFVIKANARSKKYHVPDGPGYDRTIAEVWFATEEAAQAAGFTKAEG